MPQKLNKAGKMQDYIPAGNGDPSGEYGTSKGTNKNFTASDKKKAEANVITENKSVVVGNKGKKTIPFKEWTKKDGNKERLEKGTKKWVENKSLKEKMNENAKNYEEENYNGHAIMPDLLDGYTVDYEGDEVWFKTKDEAKAFIDKEFGKKDNKANIIDGDLSGKKEESLVDEKTQKEINDRISGWDNKMRYMMLSRMQSDVKYYLGAGGRSKKDLWAQDEKEHIAYMETLYNGLKEKPEWLSKKELENYKKELLKK